RVLAPGLRSTSAPATPLTQLNRATRYTVIPTLFHAALTAFLAAAPSASCTVIFAHSRKSLVLGSFSRVLYKRRPASSHAFPLSALAVRTNARLGMPELIWTPPRSRGPL